MRGVFPYKPTLIASAVISAVISCMPSYKATAGVFVGTTPCDVLSKRVLKISDTAQCEEIKWRLTLFRESSTLAPTTYELHYTFGLAKQGTNEVADGGTTVEQKGRWKIRRGTRTKADATVYELEPDNARRFLSFRMIDPNLLHLIGDNGTLMVGNGGWSYTLNRLDGAPEADNQQSSTSIAQVKSDSSPIAPTLDERVLGTFVGRTPCRQLARQLNRTVAPDCAKLKWSLTLYQQSVTLMPTRYQLKGTLYRDRIREGSWALLHGTKTNANAIVYQVTLDDGTRLLLQADENILFFLDAEKNMMVGNDNFSYTLNQH